MYEQPLQGSPIADAIEKLRANPEIISMVASALSKSNIKKEVSAEAEHEASSEINEVKDEVKDELKDESTPAAAMPNMGELVSSLAPLFSSAGPSIGKAPPKNEHHSHTHNREALLCALKPYVNENRQTAIDYVIRISQISEMFKGLN